MNKLYYGDNLPILREHIADESVDLIYLDPPFNSNASYNVLFKSPTGEQSRAQIEAFEDTWHWNDSAEESYWQVLHGQNTDAARMLEAMRGFLGENDMMAYLAMMAVRLIELHRVLKPTGSLYLHCDPTASHYLKVLGDAVIGADHFVNEIVWKRYGAHNDVGQGSRHFGRVHDSLLFYSRSERRHWNQLFVPLDKDYVEQTYRHVEPDTGRRFMTTPLTGPGGAEKGNPVYEWNGHTRAWRYNQTKMQQLHDEGRLYYSRTGYPRQKFYIEDSKGVPVQSVWADIPSLSGQHSERLGYPTQKPVALLERIVAASSNEGDVVLDPFCGCGTTVHAAQKLGRQWIGIDVTHLAISLIERRLREAFPGIEFETIGVPQDIGGARALFAKDPHEFQKWAITLIPDAQPWKGGRKGADTGIDGIVYLRTGKSQGERAIIEVKGGEHVGVDVVHKLKSVIDREKALMGILVTLNAASAQAEREAVAAGFAEVDMLGGTARFRRIQILTIEQLLEGARPQLPIVDTTAFKRAKREDTSRQNELDL